MKNLIKDLSRKSTIDLAKEFAQAKFELAKSRLEVIANPPKDTNSLGKKRRHIARLMTVHKEKQLYELVHQK